MNVDERKALVREFVGRTTADPLWATLERLRASALTAVEKLKEVNAERR